VCGDAHTLNLKGRSLPMMYFPFRQHIPGRASFALRTELPPFSVAAAARTAVNAVDSSIPVTGLSTERQLRDRNISSERTFAVFCGTLAVVALLLSCIGFYGLMAYEVTRRTGEIGVRLALGANTRQIVQPLLQRALLLGSTGLVIGLPLIFAMTKATKASFYGVKASDPTNLCEAIVLLLSVLLLAAWIPAHRASTMDPLRALRCE